MQTGPSKGGKGGDANGSPTRMEQGGTAQNFMPHTLGAYRSTESTRTPEHTE